ncbi:MAG: cohesin domain-containing protein, partial [Candidatus Sumerlaeota bacterium]|nr:cohesin domain-containing protein [Candidatus Sumerlaeota bacterium]
YRAFGRLTGSPVFAELSTTTLTNAVFTHDSLTSGAVWEYFVTAVNRAGIEGAPSASTSSTVAQLYAWTPDVNGAPGTTVTIPVNLSNAGGIPNRTFDIWLRAPSALLEFNHVVNTIITQDCVLAAHSQAGDPDLIKLIYVNPDPLKVQPMRGEGRMTEFVFRVKGASGQSGPVSLDIVKFYDDALKRVSVDYSDRSVFSVSALFIRGDLNGDGLVNSDDIAAAIQIAVGFFVPTPRMLSAGDINGDGCIDSADVALVMDLVAGRPVNPFTPIMRRASALSAGAAGRLVALGSANVLPGRTVAIPVTVSDATDIVGCDLVVNFNPSVMSLWGVMPGSLCASLDWLTGYKTNGSSAEITLAGKPLAGGQGGEIAVLSFLVTGTAPPGAQPLALARAKLSGQFGKDIAWDGGVTTAGGTITIMPASDICEWPLY